MVAGEIDGAGRASLQPGGRSPAPGALALVQAFVNTHYDLEIEHGAELLATPAALDRWLRGHGLLADPPGRLTGADLGRALAVRESLRALARLNSHDGGENVDAAHAALNQAARGAASEVRFGVDGPRFTLSERGGIDAAFGVLLAITAGAMFDGGWSRLKTCPGADCGWVFYDHSRNRSGRWCSMSVCGGRAKARTHYLRHRRETR
jgi:predicted RNA-binding Zn ribbon-like protein